MTARACSGASSRVLAALRRAEPDWTHESVASFLDLGSHTTPLRWSRGELSMRLVDIHSLLTAVKLGTRVLMLRALLVGVDGVRVEATKIPAVDTPEVDRLAVRLARVVSQLSEAAVEALVDRRISEVERRELQALIDQAKALIASIEAALAQGSR